MVGESRTDMIKRILGTSWLHLRSLPARAGLRHGLFMFAAASLANVLDYAYNVAMGRMLSTDGYGVLVALNAVLQIVSVSMVVGSTVVARYAAEFLVQEQWARLGAFARSALKNTVLWGMGIALLLGLLSAPIARLFRVPTLMPVLVMASTLPPMVIKLITVGTLQGLQKFTVLGATHVVQAVIRLLVGVLLVKIGLGVTGALAAQPVSTAASVLLGLVFLSGIIWGQKDVHHRVVASELARYAGKTAIGIVSLAALINVDALVVKHFFAPTEAGHYSMAVTLGKIVIFVPAAFAQVLFPKSAERHAQQRDSSRLLRLSLAATLLPCGGLTAAYFAIPDVLLRGVFGAENPFGGPVLGVVALAMSGYALVNVWLNYFLSVEQPAFAYALSVALVVQLALMAIWHNSLLQVAAVVAVTSVCLLVFAEAWFRFHPSLSGSSDRSNAP